MKHTPAAPRVCVASLSIRPTRPMFYPCCPRSSLYFGWPIFFFFFKRMLYPFCDSNSCSFCTNSHETHSTVTLPAITTTTTPLHPKPPSCGLGLLWGSPQSSWVRLLLTFFLSLHYIITRACVLKVGREPTLGKLLWTKGSLSSAFYLTHACYTLQYESMVPSCRPWTLLMCEGQLIMVLGIHYPAV